MLAARNVHFAYRPGTPVIAGVSFEVHPGEIVGLSGRSGGGKSTLGRILAGYLRPCAGEVTVDGGLVGTGWSPVQYVHQSSIFSVDPRWRIGRVVEEAWHPDEATCEALGVSRSWYDRYPHEVSGGELQRVTLLRALSPATRYLIADELTAMLDPISQAEIWRHLLERSRNGLGILSISHNNPLLMRVSTRQYRLVRGLIDQQIMSSSHG